METSKLVLAAQRYEAAEQARQAAADDLKAESAAALAGRGDVEDVEDVEEAIGRPLDEIRKL